ncbi:hypothetical protein LCGC14_0831860 [marine sediment metagenome]|uniref:Uncharacterized protein n=1 Tax=marine sediment metagenome TaxID=412755 RepID=A0A0F9Q102_9ZZZZ
MTIEQLQSDGYRVAEFIYTKCDTGVKAILILTRMGTLDDFVSHSRDRINYTEPVGYRIQGDR